MAAAVIASGELELAGEAAAAEPLVGVVGLALAAATGTARATTVPTEAAADVESLLAAAVDLSLDPSPDLVLDLLPESDLSVLVSPDFASPVAAGLPAPAALPELVLAPGGGEPEPVAGLLDVVGEGAWLLLPAGLEGVLLFVCVRWLPGGGDEGDCGGEDGVLTSSAAKLEWTSAPKLSFGSDDPGLASCASALPYEALTATSDVTLTTAGLLS